MASDSGYSSDNAAGKKAKGQVVSMDDARGVNFIPRFDGLLKGARNNITKTAKHLEDLIEHGHDGDVPEYKLHEYYKVLFEIDRHVARLRRALNDFEATCSA